MLDAAWDHEQITFDGFHVPRAQLDDKRSMCNEEDLVLIVVGVPHRRPDASGSLEQAAVRLTNRLLRPILRPGTRHIVHLNRAD